MPSPNDAKVRYITGLDGLRAIAVLAVIAYHLNLGFASGGFLGVEIFFVLSGYLVTHLLLVQRDGRARLDLKQFWIRRMRRLLPALLLMLIGTVVWMTITSPDRVASFRGDVISSLIYANNWYLLFHNVSYFESFANPSPFLHLWSLAVEGQFYLLWPLLVMLGLRFTPKRWQFAAWTFALAILSAVLMAVLYEPGIDPSRVYYGTDTRVFALLIGALLAIVQPNHQSSGQAAPATKLGIHLIGTVGLVTVLYLLWTIDEYSDFLYRGGFVLLSVATVMLIAAIAYPGSVYNRIFSLKPLKWIGVRSYGIYLWHYPIIILTTPLVNTHGFSWTRAILQVAASFLIADLSWRFVETPIRKGALSMYIKHLKDIHWRLHRITFKQWMTVGCTALFIAIFGYGMTVNKPMASAHSIQTSATSAGSEQNVKQDPDASASTKPSEDDHAASPQKPASPRETDSSKSASDGGSQPTDGADGASQKESNAEGDQETNALDTSPTSGTASAKEGKLPREEPTGESSDDDDNSSTLKSSTGWSITAVGDSVMLDTSPYLKELLPGIVVDAEIGRQMSSAREVLHDYKESGKLGNGVIIALGTNGAFNSKQFRAMLESLGDRPIILVNTRVPRNWEDRVNDALDEIAADMPNVTLVDWYSASADHDSYFSPDGVHLEAEGAKAYAELLASCIKNLAS
ncbi:acyltransferase family protein [Paenibacillus sp. 1001270B_150601_E10]|uniref:acyltransferase family protein n=1 Tax=Paenibacillus sp. 1001270B_150601_E10 TaxID=2787079 RepID=UPI0018A11700|nr:acyltransferase family protein [Paenibacillus sp. 1001270B_150601_E10]